MGAGDEPTLPGGWLPPRAHGAAPPQRFSPAPPPAPPRGGPEPDPGAGRHAAWALGLGICGLAGLLLSLGTLFPVTLPCSAVAWVLAVRARARLRHGETAHGGGQAAAALWMGRIGVLAGTAAAVIFIALLASGFDFEQFREDLERELRERQNR